MPSLADVMSDLSPDPWRLNDFKAYLSRNHCLEPLQFVQDVSRYRACYAESVGDCRIPWECSRCHYDYPQAQWKDLLDAYILPTAHREINLTSKVRDRLLRFRYSNLPPHPSEFDDAVKAALELMEDSILPGFLNSQVWLEQPGDRRRGVWRRISGRLRRKISTPISERDHQARSHMLPTWKVIVGGTCCTRRYSLGGA
ncbi:RGS domain-containing protein [Fusarium oxysporum]|nr:RGS domain-containing protein [Fusarium oxysporum]